ncbi:hypothetical protein [Streptomyces nogalater]|uniref:Uncharacterized protein n=1 Tax=Streptomyces nogalater TaxID=38314 RepID=A0ABW0WC86_STRNO
MPSTKPAKDDTASVPDKPAVTASAVRTSTPSPAPAEQTGSRPGVYEYTHFTDCVYPHVPLTARAATADRPATVYAWPFGPPADGRWSPTSKSPNQAADNAPALPFQE